MNTEPRTLGEHWRYANAILCRLATDLVDEKCVQSPDAIAGPNPASPTNFSRAAKEYQRVQYSARETSRALRGSF